MLVASRHEVCGILNTRASSLCDQHKVTGGHALHAGMHESVTREYVVKAGLPSGNPAVTESLPVSKQCEHGPYSGSKVTFRVPEVACAPLKALDAITAALEPTTMIAPPVAINLSTSGFEALMQVLAQTP